MTATPCPCCRSPKGPGKYLCPNCWSALPARARCALSRRDRLALTRLRELHRQLDAGVPLSAIQVTP